MGRRILTIVLIAAATVGIIWYFKQPGAAAPAQKAAEPSKPAPATPAAAPKSTVAQIAAPKAPPVAIPNTVAKPAASTAVAAAPGDAQTELTTALDDMANIIQSGNIMALFDKYASPDDQAKMSPEERASLERQSSQMFSQPEGQQMLNVMATALQSLKDQAPELNATGDEATYQMTMTPPPSVGGGTTRTRPMTFVKVDGKWYIKGGL